MICARYAVHLPVCVNYGNIGCGVFKRGWGHSAAQVDLRCILGSTGQIIHHNHIIWISDERLRLFVLSFNGPNIARICAGQLQFRLSKKSSDSFSISVSKKILLIKKLEIEKTKPTFIISVLKVVYQVGLVYQISNFFINKTSQRKKKVF